MNKQLLHIDKAGNIYGSWQITICYLEHLKKYEEADKLRTWLIESGKVTASEIDEVLGLYRAGIMPK